MSRPVNEKRPGELRNAILQYLIKHGLTGLSLRPLAKALGCTPRVLLYHFGSKEKMVIQVLAQVREQQRTTYGGVEGASFAETYQIVWKRMSGPDSEPLFRLFFETYGMALRHPRLYKAFLHDTIENWLRLIAEELRRAGYQRGEARAFATVVLAGLRGFVLDFCTTHDRKRLDRAVGLWLRSLDSMLSARRLSKGMPLKNDAIALSPAQGPSLRLTLVVSLALGMLVTSSAGWSQLVPGSMDVHWNEGAPNCAKNPQPPLQVHPYNARTFILRENPCSTSEAPFMYLLIGTTKALLIDTGDVADPSQMPLAKTVLDLLPGDGNAKFPLLVVHTHRHLDHRAGDGQFAHLASVQVVGFDIESVRHFYNFADWPNSVAQVDLGERIVDVIPTPGHNETEVSFYDRDTGLFFSGDFLMPGRLLIDNTSADVASAERVAAFVGARPIRFALGGHIEMNSAGDTFPWGSHYHLHEHVLQMTKDDLVALPSAIRSFNGFYTVRGKFIMMNSMRILIAEAILAGGVITAIVWMLVRYIRRRKRARRLRAANQG